MAVTQESLIHVIRTQLTPIAQAWGYREAPLEQSLKGPPVVLILGNYSSGKSTLINELLGSFVQKTGQAPTDDSFTVLTYDDTSGGSASTGLSTGESSSVSASAIPEVEGHSLLMDEKLPFTPLKRHGQKFASHFRMKKVSSPFLKNLILIDTPGMIDSIAERDRGYDYQEVIADLAQIADLVLVLFDPHKAGTLRESYLSLRETLPAATFENRVVFVLNRIDECLTLADLLRVYGVLCWNLSQMLGRKDIPPIRLSYSQSIASPPSYLGALEEERTHLGQLIARAPEMRLDHLRSFARVHCERLELLLKAILEAKNFRKRALWKSLIHWMFAGLVVGVCVTGYILIQGLSAIDLAALAGGAVFLLVITFWFIVVQGWVQNRVSARLLRNVSAWLTLKHQNDRDHWEQIQKLALEWICNPRRPIKFSPLKRDLKALERLLGQDLK